MSIRQSGPPRLDQTEFNNGNYWMDCHEVWFKQSISTSTGGITTIFCADIHESQATNPHDFGDPMIFPLKAP